jgi:hypothetical protein
VVARLEAAAARLRAEDRRSALDPIEVEDRRPVGTVPSFDGELSAAQVRMRAARRRLAEIEAELGWDMRVRRAS